MARKDALIDTWVNGYTDSLSHTDGLTLLHGQGRFTGTGSDGHEVAVGDRATRRAAGLPQRRHAGDRAGTSPGSTRCRGSTTTGCSISTRCPRTSWSSAGATSRSRPGRCSAASAARSRSSSAASASRPGRTRTISDEIARFLTTEGIDTPDVHGRRTDRGDELDGVRVHIVGPSGTRPVDGSHLLVAIGRTPNTDLLDLDTIGLAPTSAASSRPTGTSAPRSKASGRSATSTAGARSPTPRTRTSRSWSTT